MLLTDAEKERLFAAMAGRIVKRYPELEQVFSDRATFERRYSRIFNAINKASRAAGLGSPAIIFKDKLVFNSLVRDLGYGAADDVALVRDNQFLLLAKRQWKPLDQLPRYCSGAVFFKLRGGSGGKQSFYTMLEGPEWSRRLAELAQEGDVLAQRRIDQHAGMSRFNPSSLNTIRVLTMNMQGRVKVIAASLRMGRKNALVDNLSSGGIFCQIDIEQGVLQGEARGSGSRRFWQHPDTGTQLTGAPIPLLPEVLRVCEELHRTLSHPPTVAWDMAVTEAGPVVVEGNTAWDGRLHLSEEARACYDLCSFYLGATVSAQGQRASAPMG